MIVGLSKACSLRSILKSQSTKVSLSSIRYARTHAQAKMRQTTLKAPKIASGASGKHKNVIVINCHEP